VLAPRIYIQYSMLIWNPILALKIISSMKGELE
jgi:hypothetical protein